MKNKLLKRANSGFSLVELIVVIAIMAILVGVAVPVYSSYIEKSEISKDKQMVDEVAHAIQIGQASGQNFGASYIILKTNGAPSVSNTALENHLKSIFGDNLDGLTLSYDGWVVNGNIIDTVAGLNAGQIGAINGSSYINNSSVSELLGNVQTVTTAASGFLGIVANDADHFVNLLSLGMGSDYVEQAYEAGILAKDGDKYTLKEGTYSINDSGKVVLSQDLSNQLANLMVFSVAEEMKTLSTNDVGNMMLGSPVVDNNGDPRTEQPSAAATMAAQYALYKAYAVDTGNNAAFERMNVALQNATDMDGVRGAFEQFTTECGAGLAAYFDSNPEVFMTNAESIPAIMQGVSSTAGNYTTADQLKDGALFTSGAVASDLNTFVGATAAAGLSSSQLTALQNVTNGVIIFVNVNGEVSIIPNMN